MLLLLPAARYLLRINKVIHNLQGLLVNEWHVNTTLKVRYRFIVGTDFSLLNANVTLK